MLKSLELVACAASAISWVLMAAPVSAQFITVYGSPTLKLEISAAQKS